MNLIELAIIFATKAHQGQVRKYTKEPYIYHPIEVSRIVWSVLPDEEFMAAALLHDVLEDTDTKPNQIQQEFGNHVLDLVLQLTDISKPEDGNRAVRKAMDRDHLRRACPRAKTIKLADLISNTDSIVEHDPDFAIVYMKEKSLLLEVLTEGNQTLYQAAVERVYQHDTKRLEEALKK